MHHFTETTMRQIMEQDLCPVMASLFKRVAEEGPGLVMDQIPVYNERAQFVGGKVINQTCYTALEIIRTEESLRKLTQIIRMVSDMPMETWGILNGITGLYRLQKAGIFDRVVDQETLAKLKETMDWRTFVDVDSLCRIRHKASYTEKIVIPKFLRFCRKNSVFMENFGITKYRGYLKPASLRSVSSSLSSQIGSSSGIAISEVALSIAFRFISVSAYAYIRVVSSEQCPRNSLSILNGIPLRYK